MHQAEAGAYTGEVSADMLVDLGIKNILIGHSERRQYFNETDKIVNEKLHLAINKGLNAVVCVGETKDEREAGITNTLLKTQTTKAFEEVAESDAKNVIIAYEPVWAIGTGLVATNEEANEACAYIRSVIADMYSQETADTIIIQYGGSVTPATVADLMGQSDIDGALVGGASLVVDSYVDLLV
jgi:triosephosphate isomerase